jgi:ABC-type uncharacterized transport system ATPase subunit
MDNTDSILHQFNLQFCQQHESNPHNFSVKEHKIGIIANQQSGETHLFFLINGLLFPALQEITLNYRHKEHLSYYDLIFETNGFIPDSNSLKSLQLLAIAKKMAKGLNFHEQYMQNNFAKTVYTHTGIYSSDICDQLKTAQCMIDNHSLFILIEPFKGLRKEAFLSMVELICDLRRFGKIVLLASNNFGNIHELYNHPNSHESGQSVVLKSVIIG